MPKQSLQTLEVKQKVYLRLIVQMQKDLAKVTKSIQSMKSKSAAKKPAPKKAAAKKTVIKKPAARKAPAKKAAAPKKASRPAKGK